MLGDKSVRLKGEGLNLTHGKLTLLGVSRWLGEYSPVENVHVGTMYKCAHSGLSVLLACFYALHFFCVIGLVLVRKTAEYCGFAFYIRLLVEFRYSLFGKTTMSTAEDRITKQKQKVEQETARLKKLEAIEREKAKKLDTRRKVLIGAYYLEQANKSPEEMEKLLTLMDSFLVRDSDRKVFGLSPTTK